MPQRAGTLAAIQIGAQRSKNRQAELAAIDRGQFVALQARVQHQLFEAGIPAMLFDHFLGDQAEQPFVVAPLHASVDAGQHLPCAPAEWMLCSMMAVYRSRLVAKWRKMIASETPAASAISFVVVPAKPLRENRSMAASINWRRRSEAGRQRRWVVEGTCYCK